MSPLSRRTFVAGLLASPVAAACGGSGGSPDAGVAAPSTTAVPPPTAPPVPIQPLTGMVHGGDPAILRRPALVVKVNNLDTGSNQGRPQAGINQADVVFEERTEGGITRFAAIYHANDADPLFPVRSARMTDLDITSMLNRPLFANSGGDGSVMGAVRAANLVPIGHEDVGDQYYYRLRERRIPHNLATSTPVLYRLTPPEAEPPPPLFRYRPAGTPPVNGEPAGGVHVQYGGGPAEAPVDHVWDPAVSGWARSQNGTPHVDTAGIRIAPQNLIVQFTNYDGTRGVLTGEGSVLVFTGGVLIRGSWHRPDPTEPTRYVDATGGEILLEPGRTWVLLPPPNGATIL